ncbi:MAG: dephospho-CoA kinase [Thermoanaerobaculales bacterium]|nr:dephospho-CoA kinase [Thermoanaerobaculales bacterium]
MVEKRTCRVGLTGGLASGKSTVAALLAQKGVPVFDADDAVHGLYAAGASGARAVGEIFGPDILTNDGSVDREALAARAMGDAEARDLLNRTIHPLVRLEVERWFSTVGEPVAVTEAALLVETGSWRAYDVLMVVSCRPDQQLERALARGLSLERAHTIFGAQAPLEEKLAIADVIVDNSGPAHDLETEVERAWLEVLRSCYSSAGANHSVS